MMGCLDADVTLNQEFPGEGSLGSCERVMSAPRQQSSASLVLSEQGCVAVAVYTLQLICFHPDRQKPVLCVASRLGRQLSCTILMVFDAWGALQDVPGFCSAASFAVSRVPHGRVVVWNLSALNAALLGVPMCLPAPDLHQ